MRDLVPYEAELLRGPQLVSAILANPRVFPPVPPAPRRQFIRCDAASVDAAICKGLALAVNGIQPRIEVII